MSKYKIGQFLFNGDSFGVLVDIIRYARKGYMVRWDWDDDPMSYAYDSGDIRMFKKLYEIEVGEDDS